jgi:DNA-directed RNA polymerase specialized sigma24 family protein
MSIEEVARAMASTVGAVKQEAHRAYERLRAVLEQAETSRAGVWWRFERRREPDHSAEP